MNEPTSTASNTEEPERKLEVEQRIGGTQSFLLGLQHVFVSNVWLDPLFIAVMIGMTPFMTSGLINAVFVVAGLVTLTQATRLAKLPIVQGPSASFDALMISTGKTSGLAAASGGMLVSAIVVFILSITGWISKLRSWFTPAVAGTVICVVGIALSQFTMYEFLGGAPGEPGFLASPVLILSITTAAIVVILANFGRGWLQRYAFLIALLVGDVVACCMGKIDFSTVGAQDWFALPKLLPYGAIKWDMSIIVSFLIAYLAAIMEAMGVYQAASEVTDVKLDDRRIRRGFVGESSGSILSSFLGGLPTTAYAQNVSLLRLTRTGSRYPIIWAGAIFLVLGFVPKAGAVLALTPSPVVGGLFLPAAAGLIMSGVSLLTKMEKTEANFTIVGLAIVLAIALPGNMSGVSGFWGTVLTNQVLVGALSVLLLQLLLVSIPKRIRKLNK
ncbi:Xanthine/uracil/vitamin C permease [Paenibacillus curdlanolyticus YK9]|uniref:Xanthine/uracil/vitamin C permease n=1 Tax=Paenibacillus curdlanolyticus YK9 TaxID=717606 RepID=E0I3N1_9BACL|nr:solute carrier family 23 protein [Paenibacillus curdlanolyticus]EFM12895.1 Xanthine/uracil/vitamin C permease [Paenibacillus curdlanolyticus YK9]